MQLVILCHVVGNKIHCQVDHVSTYLLVIIMAAVVQHCLNGHWVVQLIGSQVETCTGQKIWPSPGPQIPTPFWGPAWLMSMSIMNLYSAESWSISTALCVLSGNAEISSSSSVVGNDHRWAPGHGDYPVVNSRPSDLRQRRPDDQKYWAGDVVLSGDVDWQSADVVCWQCLRLVCSNRPGKIGGLVVQTSVHCYSQLVVDAFWDVKPVQLVMQQEWQAVVELSCSADETCCSIQHDSMTILLLIQISLCSNVKFYCYQIRILGQKVKISNKLPTIFVYILYCKQLVTLL